jgi:hypothetical protein
MDIYSRLYKYRERPSVSPLENFLTESLADIFNRLPMPIQTEFLVWMLPASCRSRLRNKCMDGKQIEAETQVPIGATGSVKRPDIIVYLDDEPLILIEVKVHAALQEHMLENPKVEPIQGDVREIVFQNQLKTYSEWIRSQCTGDWSGAVVFLTHGTRAPDGFENDGREGNSVIGVTQTWKNIGDWLAKNPDLNKSETTHRALASDFKHFLERQGLMSNFMTSRDLAATALFMPAHRALNHTIKKVIFEVASKYPKSKSGNVGSGFSPDMKSYYAWYYLNNKLNPGRTKFFIGIGICFPDQGALGSENPVGVPRDEPFFFIQFTDDWKKAKASTLFSKLPEGWVEINEDYDVVIARAVSQFEADPDDRVQSLINWALEEVGRAAACIPNFEAVPVENIQVEAEG